MQRMVHAPVCKGLVPWPRSHHARQQAHAQSKAVEEHVNSCFREVSSEIVLADTYPYSPILDPGCWSRCRTYASSRQFRHLSKEQSVPSVHLHHLHKHECQIEAKEEVDLLGVWICEDCLDCAADMSNLLFQRLESSRILAKGCLARECDSALVRCLSEETRIGMQYLRNACAANLVSPSVVHRRRLTEINDGTDHAVCYVDRSLEGCRADEDARQCRNRVQELVTPNLWYPFHR